MKPDNQELLEALIKRVTKHSKDRMLYSFPAMRSINCYYVTISPTAINILKRYAKVKYYPKLGMLDLYY